MRHLRCWIPMILLALAILPLTLSCAKKRTIEGVEASVVAVKTERVSLGPVDDFYEATGTVRSKTTSVLSARTPGNVVAVHVREGDRVRSGQLLVEIDSRDATVQLHKAQAGVREAENAVEEVDRNIRAAQAARSAAQASFTLAASTHARYQKLLERRSVSPQEFDEVQAKYEVAEAEADRATRMLAALEARRNQVLAKIDQARSDVSSAQLYASYARVTSPINGLVTSKQTEPGMMASPGVPLITIEDNSHYRLEASVEESQLGSIKIGDDVRVQIDALGEQSIDGRAAEIVPAADPATRSYAVKIDLPANKSLRSGLYGKASFAREKKQGITVSRQAVVLRGQLTAVLVVDEMNTARMRLITTGKSFGDRVEVLTGLIEGDRIVVERAGEIAEGSRIKL